MIIQETKNPLCTGRKSKSTAHYIAKEEYSKFNIDIREGDVLFVKNGRPSRLGSVAFIKEYDLPFIPQNFFYRIRCINFNPNLLIACFASKFMKLQVNPTNLGCLGEVRIEEFRSLLLPIPKDETLKETFTRKLKEFL